MEPLKVALLGCGVVGTEVARLLTTHADELARASVRRWSSSASPCAASAATAACPSTRAVHRPTPRSWSRAPTSSSRSSAGSSRRATLILRGDGARRVGRHRQQGAARRGRPDAVRGRRASTASTSTSRPPSPGAIPLLRPLRESLAGDRVTPRARHRQRHDELRPGQDGHHRRGPRRGRRAGAGARATPRPTRPPTSRASTPPPRPPSSPRSPSTPASRSTTCTARGSPRSPPPTCAAARSHGLRRQAAGDLRARHRAPSGDEGVSVRVHPAMIPRSHPLAGVREAYNAVFVEAESAGRADVLRPRRRGAPDRQRDPGRPRRRCPPPRARRPRAGRVGLRRPAACGRWATRVTRYHISLDVADRPGVLAQVAQVFAAHGVSIETVRQQRAGGGRADGAPRPCRRWSW